MRLLAGRFLFRVVGAAGPVGLIGGDDPKDALIKAVRHGYIAKHWIRDWQPHFRLEKIG